jgi:hypothetical protein
MAEERSPGDDVNPADLLASWTRAWPSFARFFDGLELVEPGIVALPEWRGPGSEYPVPCYAGMARKP